ncbi:LysR substrate-binding domain-containing protein [Cupriavidus basilensis]|uniref:LysR substrate-binding domain-containing protein n=1 Tax=Cupriavidus basilensis TaxID=68895 RepID=UPI001ED8DB18|nr:LysR substrate-binding domain-containing protein [Cupriavidus basilensis]
MLQLRLRPPRRGAGDLGVVYAVSRAPGAPYRAPAWRQPPDLVRLPRLPCAPGRPRTLADLASHDCLVIKERDHPFGVWKLRNGIHGNTEQTVKVTGPLSSNHGEIVVRWAVDGRGIVLRSLWDVGPQLATGELEQILPECHQEANIWAVYPSRLTASAKIRVCVEFFEAFFRERAASHGVMRGRYRDAG